MPPPRPPNKDLLEHEKMRKVEAQLFKLGKELREKGGKTEEEIEEAIKNARVHMLDKLKNAPTLIDSKESHQAALAKEKHMEKLKSALNISEKHEFGAAFDVELQETKRLERIAEKDRMKKEQKKAQKEAKRQEEREKL
mmetsp:Transcript_24852/g.24338  ORF Transcript_24852/g.24338 Transcript_24852/m.24338 type:complete len:139 (+) Transcript_24852:157-573(+)|eukprot:CAMPEP_0170558886 /NCGR_PEP_ID=MMETSP0211-20121228/38624_1 /TAXON_ID=311385 /ORGANISM="Pseudokeronopsis sp., Strain OXSARD2" /LENGTH=138 /DNA_ID=CAMNT_0010871299 /DNA_START=90 /DNA_END=506 /DNA_ORIENTATION=-